MRLARHGEADDGNALSLDTTRQKPEKEVTPKKI
jgi:hypothetical protein